MSPQAELLFYELADLSTQDREKYFSRNAVPADLRAEVESLLHHDLEKLASLTGRVAGGAEQLLRGSAGDTGRCGPYQLIRILGHGGMGAVYLAQRADGEVEQQVAVKLLRNGSGQKSFRDRFLRERQILASLSHPGIARLVDAGHTSDGQPYLAMDFIDGEPIDKYAAKLGLRGKLELFVAVCDAVAHAHRNLVIHRDIKPSNILVNDAGQPKLLDFGIAKILDATSDQTRTRERLLTPDYASPEQVRGMAQNTATDVYSLGAVLYKLLTGRSPHHFASETQDDMEVAICTRELVPASRLDPGIPRDLDFVLMKALRKEPQERYVSVDALADDLRAFLEWRPVGARSGNAWYRTRKFIRRYWLPVVAASLTVAGLSIGMFVANRERAVAERRFQQVRQLANKLFVLDADLVAVPGTTKARLGLAATSKEYLAALAGEARGDRELAYEIGTAYISLARIQGVPTQSNLGQLPEAEQSLSHAESFIEPLLTASPTDRKLLLNSAEIAHDRMIIAESSRKEQEALKHAGRAVARIDTLLQSPSSTDSEKTGAARVLVNVAQSNMNLHRFEEALGHARRAITLARESKAPLVLVSGLSLYSNVLRQTGHLEEALRAVEESRHLLEKSSSGGSRSSSLLLYGVLWREGMILGADEGISLNRPTEAAARFQLAFDLMEQIAAADPNDSSGRSRIGTAGRELCKLLRHTDPQRALNVCDLATRRIREIRSNIKARRDEAVLLAFSSYSLDRLGRKREAEDRLEAAFAILRQTKDHPAPKIDPGEPEYFVLKASADHLAESGNIGRAIETYQDLLAKVTASKPDPLNDLRHATDLSRIYQPLARLLHREKHTAAAARLDTLRAELWRHWDSKLRGNSYVQRQLAALH